VREFRKDFGLTGTLIVGSDDAIEFFDGKMFNNICHLLYDWTNFNTAHSSYEMARVIEKLGETINGAPDYAAFCSAIAESMYHMWLLDDDGKKHKIDYGLYSGWRGTTWIK